MIYTDKEKFLRDAYGKILQKVYPEHILNGHNETSYGSYIVTDVDASNVVWGYKLNPNHNNIVRIGRLNYMHFFDVKEKRVHEPFYMFVDENTQTKLVLDYFNLHLDKVKDMIYNDEIIIKEDGRLILTNEENYYEET